MCSMARASLYCADAARPAASSVSPVASEIRCRWKKLWGLFTGGASGCGLVWINRDRKGDRLEATVSEGELSTIRCAVGFVGRLGTILGTGEVARASST